jgi:hypothetical protein
MAAVRTFRLKPVLCWVVLMYVGPVGFLSAPTLANEGEAESPPTPPRYLSLNRLDAYLELRGEFTYDRVKTSGGRFVPPLSRRQRNIEWRFEERLGLQLDGDIIDPAFITFAGDLNFALTQSRFKEKLDHGSQTDKDSGHLTQFDLRADFFRAKKVSGSVYGLRQEYRIDRPFQPSLDERRTGFGTNWLYSDDKLPMEFSYDYLDTDRTGNTRERDDEHYTESTLRYALDWIIAEHNRFKFSWEHAETKQNFQGARSGFETTRDLLDLRHDYEFGPDLGHALRTLLRVQEEDGDFARDFIEFGPQLTLHHSDAFQTLYKYQFLRERYEALDVSSHRLDFQAIHQLYTNLTTTFNAFALYEDIKRDINTTQYGASIDWQYNRKNPYGHLYANLALAYDTEDVEGDNGRRVILDEAHVLRDPIAATLRNRNVIRESIVVSDATNRRFFRAGLDYIVHTQGNATRISRVQTGLIADGETILVDYQFRTPADGKLDTVRVDLHLEQRFTNGLTPYYRLSYRNQEDDTSTGFLRRADRTNHHRLGVNYDAKRYRIGGEYEIFDDTVEPYDAFHVHGRLAILTDPDHKLDAATRVSRFFFESSGFEERNVTRLDVEIDHRWRLSDSISTVERLGYRYQTDSARGLTRGWDVAAGLEYVTGDLSGELTFEYDLLDVPGSVEDGYGVFVRVRREFRDVLARR